MVRIAEPIKLDKLSEAIKTRDLDMEFRILVRITETNLHSNKVIDYCPFNCKLNRYSTVIPCKVYMTLVAFNIVKLGERDSSLGIDVNQYINASHIKVVLK